MKLLFIADPLEGFSTKKDSTYAMMREAQARGHSISACQPHDISWTKATKVCANVRHITLTPPKNGVWFTQNRIEPNTPLHSFDAVLMRKDPPFDSEYLYCTHLLSQAEREGARVFNSPQALREHPEKLAILEFAQYISPTLVTRDAQAVREFHAAHKDIILKPLDGMGGAGIFRVREDGLNLGSILETVTNFGQQTIMVQQFLPEITQGDKRVLIINGKPVPHCLARIPQGSEVRGNLAAGGLGVAQPLNDTDYATATAIGEQLAPRGLMLIGLDIIGSKVTEINVTSPTCFQEIHDQAGFDVAAMFIDALEQAV